jgi:hypothetical protein
MMLTPTDMLIMGMVLASLACLRRKRCGGEVRRSQTDATEMRRAQNDVMMEVETWRHGL